MTKNRPRNSQSGFSLIELLIVSVIMAFTIGIISTIVASIQRNYSQQRVRTEALNDANAALDMMTRLIRNAGNNPDRMPPFLGIDPETPVGSLYKTIHIRSDWRGLTMASLPDGDTEDPLEDIRFFVQNNVLMKQEPDDATAVEFLDNVLDMQFLYYDTNNVLIVDPVANNAAIARVGITIIMQPPRSTPQTFTSSAYVRLK
jgi:prepilin-type N-terminal cleavage/methylation domain-containing protein